MSRWPRWIFYVVALIILVLDQASKAWAVQALKPIRDLPLIPGFFNLTYVQNTGVAFGLMAGKGTLVALLILVLLILTIAFTKGLDWMTREPNLVGGLLGGGAVSNLLDRARLGYVVDLFNVHAGSFYWPVFNVADSAICIAVGWIAFRQFFPQVR